MPTKFIRRRFTSSGIGKILQIIYQYISKTTLPAVNTNSLVIAFEFSLGTWEDIIHQYVDEKLKKNTKKVQYNYL